MKGSGGRIRGEVVKVAVVALMAAGLAGFGTPRLRSASPGRLPQPTTATPNGGIQRGHKVVSGRRCQEGLLQVRGGL